MSDTMKTLVGFIIVVVLTTVLIRSCYGATFDTVIGNEVIDITQDEVIDILPEFFDNEVVITVPPNIEITNNDNLKEISYVLEDSKVIDIFGSESIIYKKEQIIVVEKQPVHTKILYKDEYYFIPTKSIGPETMIEEDVIYPFSEEIPLSKELQSYIYDKCVTNNIKYCLFLGLCQQESDFGRYKARNGVQFHVISSWGDYGMCQTNKKYVWPDVKKVFGWNDITILFDPYKSVDAGIWEFSRCVKKYGNSEAAYDAYNRGLEHGGSTENSRAVVRYWNHWKSILGDI